MDDGELSTTKVLNRKEKLKAKSLPVTPSTSPYMVPDKRPPRKMSLFSLEDQADQMDYSTNDVGPIFSFLIVICDTCGKGVCNKFISEHGVLCAASREKELREFLESAQARGSQRAVAWRESMKQLQQADKSKECDTMDDIMDED
jgi:hypothetical protein